MYCIISPIFKTPCSSAILIVLNSYSSLRQKAKGKAKNNCPVTSALDADSKQTGLFFFVTRKGKKNSLFPNHSDSLDSHLHHECILQLYQSSLGRSPVCGIFTDWVRNKKHVVILLCIQRSYFFPF